MGRRKYTLVLAVLLIALAASLLDHYLRGHSIAVLSPKGQIAAKERSLIIESTLLMLIVVVPVYFMTFAFAWRYRESNKKAKYTPDWDHHVLLELAWWAFPLAIISILSVVAWRSSHELDPFKNISSNVKPLTVQVVALDWKWLFIYPQQNVASVNELAMPVNTPVNFQITADAPMNSFWIPRLGGQVYAMSGMATQLHLVADQEGSYYGSSANISGRGFAGMHFFAKAMASGNFNDWVRDAKKSSQVLSLDQYNSLVKPTTDNPVAYYSSQEAGLFDYIVHKYMTPDIATSTPVANLAHNHGSSY